MTLADFLLARIGEDEAAALPDNLPSSEGFRRGRVVDAIRRERAERVQSIALDLPCPTCQSKAGDTCVAMTPPHHAPKPAEQFHSTRRDLARVELRRRYGSVVQWNAARVLAECDAKRRIVRRFVALGGEPTDPYKVLAMMGEVYADHPDYDESWRP